MTSLECYCRWFRCPADLEAALLELAAPGCGPVHPAGRVVLRTYADCRRLVVSKDFNDGPSESWHFDSDTHQLIGASRSAWPVYFEPTVCPGLSYVRALATYPRTDADCAQPTYRDLCAADAGTGADVGGGDGRSSP